MTLEIPSSNFTPFCDEAGTVRNRFYGSVDEKWTELTKTEELSGF